jgi:UDPglucose 6-dehydrogenase
VHLSVIGTGYVGLVAGACFAEVGHDVVCADHDRLKVAMLRQGQLPIFEPNLLELVQRNVRDGRLRFTDSTHEAVEHGEIIFMAVGTPADTDGSADLSHVLIVADEIGTHLRAPRIIVCKSTVPVGTCDLVSQRIRSRSDVAFEVVSNPEFLKEGSAVSDFMSPDRVVIGCVDPASARKVGELYRAFMRRNDRILYTDVRSAEMTKYASNAMLAAKISFINEIANLCDAVGADVELVRRGMSMDERIGPHFIFPGVGYGGSCFPKDVRALARLGDQQGQPTHMLDAIETINGAQKLRLFELVNHRFDGDLHGRSVAIWGLSFKPLTDDVRESPAIVTIRRLVQAGATVTASDPAALEVAREALADLGDAVRLSESSYAALEDAEALLIFTEWNEYRSPDFDRMRALLRQPLIFDGRNLYQPDHMRSRGFEYHCIGRRARFVPPLVEARPQARVDARTKAGPKARKVAS